MRFDLGFATHHFATPTHHFEDVEQSASIHLDCTLTNNNNNNIFVYYSCSQNATTESTYVMQDSTGTIERKASIYNQT